LQREVAMVVNVAYCLNYADVPNPTLCDQKMLVSIINKAMDSVWNEHINVFHKRLHVCDLTLGAKFFQQVQVHYNMNINCEMMMEKLQLLVSSQMNNEQNNFG
jgi:hypothetical protein